MGKFSQVFTLVLAFVLNLLLGEQKKLLGKLNVGKFKGNLGSILYLFLAGRVDE